MNKILLIIQREYLSRVKKRSFLLTTFLVPIFFIAMYVGMFFLTKKSYENTHATIFVYDEIGEVKSSLEDTRNITYIEGKKTLSEQIKGLREEEGKNLNVLIIPDDFFESKKSELLSTSKPNVQVQSEVKSQLKSILTDYEYQRLGIDAATIKNIDTEVMISAKEISETGDTQESHTGIVMAISMGMAILVYLSLFLYGAQVMRGIIEEKSSRIVEVIISSVKPFQLMMGKIVGIGLVGLTQFLLWILLTVALIAVATTTLIDSSEVAQGMQQSSVQDTGMNLSSSGNYNIQNILQAVNFPLLLTCFLLFFLGGYLLYSALFAAVGSAVDSETEASQFTMPITMPLLLTYILSFGVLVNDPNGTIATWLSMIPFTSPIAMLVRIPFGVPTWQIAVSFILLIGGFILTTWAAARIYRVGILMYGKKASFKEIVKWFGYKN